MVSKTDKEAAAEEIPPGSASALAAAIAHDRTKADPVQSSRAEVFLEEQTRLIRLQSEQLNEQRRLLLGSLRFRHLGEVLTVLLQTLLGIIGLGAVAALGAAVWIAAHDNSLVVEPFGVPPEFVSRGLTGKVVASQLLDRLTDIQNFTETHTSRAPSTYRNNWGNDIKVQIPDTGISVGEFYQYLTQWLGNQTRIGGEIYRTQSGVAVTARAGGMPARTFEGSEAALTTLMQKAAEDIYRRTQPYRYSVYLSNHGRTAESEIVLHDLLAYGPDSEFKWAHAGLANDLLRKNQYMAAAEEAHKAISLDPKFGFAFYLLASIEAARGHDEEALQALNAGIPLLEASNSSDMTAASTKLLPLTMRAQRDELLGDYSAALTENRRIVGLRDYSDRSLRSEIGQAGEFAALHDVRHAVSLLRDHATIWQKEPVALAQAALLAAVQTGDRAGIQRALGAKMGGLQVFLEPVSATIPIRNPGLACNFQALAIKAALYTGAYDEAETRSAHMPHDCYNGVRAMGAVAARGRKWSSAAYWLSIAADMAPSLPFAHMDLAAMFFSKGNFDKAIGELERANRLAPRFADPLELWGELLIRRNRSDLALAKFGAAAKLAPDWGRLQLKWAEALAWSHQAAEARSRFALAHRLYLSPAEHAELARYSRATGR